MIRRILLVDEIEVLFHEFLPIDSIAITQVRVELNRDMSAGYLFEAFEAQIFEFVVGQDLEGIAMVVTSSADVFQVGEEIEGFW